MSVIEILDMIAYFIAGFATGIALVELFIWITTKSHGGKR